MTCPSPLVRSMYTDGALALAEAEALEQHLEICAACRDRVAALRVERQALRAALQDIDDVAPIPVFTPPLRGRELALLALGATVAAGLAGALWSELGAAVPRSLHWLNPFKLGELFELALNLATFVIYEGTEMWSDTMNLVGATLILALAAWVAVTLTRNRPGTAVLVSLLAVAIALPSLGHALEIRRGTVTTVSASETIDDTLIAAGETIAIDGNVNGDLLAFGRSVTVRGNVAGDLLAGAETVRVEGTVGGNVIGFGRGVTLSGTRVARNLYGFGRDVEIDADSDVAGNAIAFGEGIDVNGRVGIDVKGFGSDVTVAGNVLGDVEAFAGGVTLLPSARIAGNLTVHMQDPDDLQLAAGAVVGGSVDRQVFEREDERNEYLTVGFYVGQIVRLGAAFLTGLLLLWLFPPLRALSLPDVPTALRTAGIGLAAAVTLPVAAVLLCLTIVGLPIGITVFMLGAVALYFAKAVVAQLIGRKLFRGPLGEPHYAATLLAGLVIVIIAISLPFLGGILNLALTLIGLGMIVTLLFARFQQR